MRNGLLVTGLPRSGTSWVGKMLEAGGEVVYVNEPLNPRHPPGRSPGVLNAEVTHRFQYICADNEEPWARAFDDTLALRYQLLAELRRNHRPYDLARLAKYYPAFTLGRLRGRRAMLDDPYAVLSAAWFASRLEVSTLVLVRDPVAFAGSWRKLGWTVDLGDLLGQPLLMRDLLGPYEGEMKALLDSGDDLAKNALLWRMTHEVVDGLREAPGLHIRRYEDLAGSPDEAFAELYETMGLTWNKQAAAGIAAATSPGQSGQTTPGRGRGFSWSLRGGLSRTAFRPMDSRAALDSYKSRLTEDEITRVRDLTAGVAERF